MVQRQKIGEGFVEFSAKLDKYIRDLKRAERLAKKSGAASGKNFGEGAKGATDKLASAAGALAKVEVAAKSAEAILKLMEGDAQGFVDQVKALPFGLGAVASLVEAISNNLSGWTDEVKKFDKANKALEGRVRQQSQTGQREVRFQNIAQQLERQAALAETRTPQERGRLSQRFQRQDIEAQLTRSANTITKGVDNRVRRALTRLEATQSFNNQTVQRMQDPTSRTISANRFAFQGEGARRREPTEEQMDTLIELNRSILRQRSGARVN